MFLLFKHSLTFKEPVCVCPALREFRSSLQQMFVLECASVCMCVCVCSTHVSRINRLIAEMSVSVTG